MPVFPAVGATTVQARGRRARYPLRQVLYRLQNRPRLAPPFFWQRLEGIAGDAPLAAVRQDRLGDGGQVAAVPVGRRVADVPQLACQELPRGDAALNDALVAEVVDLGVAKVVTLQIGVGADEDPSVRQPLGAGQLAVARQVEGDPPADVFGADGGRKGVM